MPLARTIAGLDEAGRGPLAGPLVAAAVVFPADFCFTEHLPALKFSDSKHLTRRQRERLVSYIHQFALAVHVEVVSVEDINIRGIGWANRTAFERLIVGTDADDYVVDGNMRLDHLGPRARHVHSMVRADETLEVVAAASIVAKVRRDEIMCELHTQFPIYGWDHNMGYGTAQHVAVLRAQGPCIHHRRQFVATALTKPLRLPGFEGNDTSREQT